MSSATPTPLPRERKTNTWSSRCVTWTTSQMHTVTASSGEKLCKNGSRVIAKKEYLCISLSRGLFVFYWLWCCCIKWLVFTDHHKNYLRIIGVFMRIQVPATVAKFKSNGNVPFSLPPPSICPPPQKKKKDQTHAHASVTTVWQVYHISYAQFNDVTNGTHTSWLFTLHDGKLTGLSWPS